MSGSRSASSAQELAGCSGVRPSSIQCTTRFLQQSRDIQIDLIHKVPTSCNGNNIPSFVGQNYFCESGLNRWNGTSGVFWPDGDPLWDGQGCGITSSCCTFNSPPWFNVTLSSPTTDDIEVRICGRASPPYIDSPIQLMELYVK